MIVHLRNTTLSAHEDGELSPTAAAQVEEHLKHCDRCRTEYRKIAGAANAVRHLTRMPAPVNLAARVREQIDAEERGMVPVLREEILRARRQSGFFSALGLGTLATVLLIGIVLTADYRYGEQAAQRITSAWLQSTLPEPVLLHEPMSSPRFRDGFGNMAFAQMQNGREGTLLTNVSIDQYGSVQGLEVIYRSGDEEMLSLALQAVLESGFEPVRLGNQNVPVYFLYFFTTTEVRPDGPRLSALPLSHRA